MSKKLNESGVTSELRGQSAFFPKRARSEGTEEPTPTAVRAAPPLQVTSHESTTVPTNERTKQRSLERKKIRHTFDIYHDQLLSLRELALQREITFGERTLLGDLVQEALDLFITKERNKE